MAGRVMWPRSRRAHVTPVTSAFVVAIAIGVVSALPVSAFGPVWRLQSTPNPSGFRGSELYGVACPSTSLCTAVGYYYTSSGVSVTLAERWNGTMWVVQPTPNASGATYGDLYGVACPSTTLCTAVGFYTNSSGVRVTLAERWNGSTWVVQPTPNPSATASELFGVACPSTTQCTAVGSYKKSSGVVVTLAERWNGSTWVVRPTPNPSGSTYSELEGVACPSTTRCIAAGYETNSSGVRVALAESWNGSTWSIQSTPNPGGPTGSLLFNVACPTTTQCTAVGYYTMSSGAKVTLAERWNGSTWVVQPTPNPTNTSDIELEGVACPSTTHCTAVGLYINGSSAYVTLAEAWNGITWAIQSTPNPSGVAGSLLFAVACRSTTMCTAGGYDFISSGFSVTLAERYS